MRFTKDFEATLKLIVEINHYKKGTEQSDYDPGSDTELEFSLYVQNRQGMLELIPDSMSFLYDALYENVLEEAEERQADLWCQE